MRGAGSAPGWWHWLGGSGQQTAGWKHQIPKNHRLHSNRAHPKALWGHGEGGGAFIQDTWTSFSHGPSEPPGEFRVPRKQTLDGELWADGAAGTVLRNITWVEGGKGLGDGGKGLGEGGKGRGKGGVEPACPKLNWKCQELTQEWVSWSSRHREGQCTPAMTTIHCQSEGESWSTSESLSYHVLDLPN